MTKDKGHTGGSSTPPAMQETPISLLRDIKHLLSLAMATDMPADGEDYRDIAIPATAGEISIELDVQIGYVYIPNCPRDITVYSGYRGQLIGSFKQGAFVKFRMPRTTGIFIVYSAGTAAQTFTVYSSARDIEAMPGEVIATPGTNALGLGKIEDTPHVTGDVGVQVLAVRNDAAAATLTSLDGDYSSLAVDNKGRIQIVAVAPVATADGSSTTAGFFPDNAGSNRPIPIYNFVYNGLTFDRLRTPVIFKTFNLAASSAEQTIWTPAAGKKFRLMGFVLTINTLAATVTFRDNTAGTTIFLTAGPAASVIAPSNMGNGILSAAANNLLTIQASAVSALVGTVWGTEE